MRLTCGKCDNGWICEEHPDFSRGRMTTAAGRVCRARIPPNQVQAGFGSNLPDGMKRIADAMVRAARAAER